MCYSFFRVVSILGLGIMSLGTEVFTTGLSIFNAESRAGFFFGIEFFAAVFVDVVLFVRGFLTGGFVTTFVTGFFTGGFVATFVTGFFTGGLVLVEGGVFFTGVFTIFVFVESFFKGWIAAFGFNLFLKKIEGR